MAQLFQEKEEDQKELKESVLRKLKNVWKERKIKGRRIYQLVNRPISPYL